MEIKTEAIVLRSIKYGEQSLIIDMLTQEQGRVSFIVRIPKTRKGRLKKQLFQPLTLLSIVFDCRQQQSLQHIRDINLSEPYVSLTAEPAKVTVAMFLAEFLTYATRDTQKDIPLFGYIKTSLQWLDSATKDFSNFHIVFMLRLSSFIGFRPNLESYTDNSMFDLREGRFTTLTPLHNDYLKPAEARIMLQLFRMDYANMRFFRMSRLQRNRLTDIILHYYRLHIPAMPELHCIGILHSIFV